MATHEFGHTFGLQHSGCYQTMRPAFGPCNAGPNKLGKGDVVGLRKLY